MKRKYSFFQRNGLTIALFALAIGALAGQSYMGWKEYLEFLEEHHLASVSLWQYFTSGHFIQATFENWESEFLQMAVFIILTIFLRQQGSSESKSFEGGDEVDKQPMKKANAPWAVRKGGVVLLLYKHSLSIVLIALFLISFVLHWYGSWRHYNLHQMVAGKPIEPFFAYLHNTRMWFESFQNWQSEFISIGVLIVLTIFLRQQGSPQSKPVDAPNEKTGA